MKIHPRPRTLVRYEDQTLGHRRASAVAHHLERCDRCRARIRSRYELRDAARDLTTVQPPGDAWDRIRARLDAGDAVILPETAPGRRPPQTGRKGLRAAVLILLGAAAGAFAVPGSPAHDWVRARLGPEAPEAVAPGVDAAPVGVAVEAPAGFSVRLLRPGPGLRIAVELVDGTLVEARASGPARRAVFRTGESHLTIVDAVDGQVWLGLPRSGPSIAVELDGRQVLVSDGGRMDVLGRPITSASVVLTVPDTTP